MSRKMILAAITAAACTLPGFADDKTKSNRGSHEIHQTMMSGMEKMHDMKLSGDTDHDFASMMIAHHEQAIEMSKAALDHGDDPEVRKKAREIIAASEKDIRDLKKWQKQHH
jgi:uncharacterized protein (DUF305 family)